MSTTAPSATSALGSVFTRWKFWVFLAVITVLTAIIMQMIEPEEPDPYGLSNTDLNGYAAFASVIEDEGAQIHQADSAEAGRELLREYTDDPVVVMIDNFPPDDAFVSELGEQHAQGRDVLWLVDTPYLVADILDDQTEIGPAIATDATGTAESLEAGEECSIEAAVKAESIQSPGETLLSDSGCFVAEDGDNGSAYALVESRYGLIFTAPAAFTNQAITAEGNAALGLGLLEVTQESATSDLLWYQPSGADQVSSDQWASPVDFLPGWFWALTAWSVICALVAMVVAGRRHGPVVAEPLPVVVPSSESSYGRGRLYQQSNAVEETARTLRNAHLLRMGRILRLGPFPSAHLIAAGAAKEAGWETQQVETLLLNTHVNTNTQLTTYAQQLAELEHAVIDSTRMRRRASR